MPERPLQCEFLSNPPGGGIAFNPELVPMTLGLASSSESSKHIRYVQQILHYPIKCFRVKDLEPLKAAGCELYGTVDDTELATLGKRAIINQLFHVTPETIEYLGDRKIIVALLRRAQIQSSAPVRPFKAVQIQKGKMSKVQEIGRAHV